jgi:NDP-sugar pyrophosphorylase family protein
VRELNILMPMAGYGKRFSSAGWTIPKPFITVDQTPMFIKALSSFDSFNIPCNISVVIREEIYDQFDFDSVLKLYDKEIQVIRIPKPTKGALETCIAAKDWIVSENSLIVMDCDLWFTCTNYINLVKKSIEDKLDLDGFIPVFKSDLPKYSYALIDDEYVIQTAEKKVISNNAIAGAYFFNSTKQFMMFAERLVRRPANESEYYVSLIYNEYIKDKLRIGSVLLDNYKSFGTPEELERV